MYGLFGPLSLLLIVLLLVRFPGTEPAASLLGTGSRSGGDGPVLDPSTAIESIKSLW